MGALDLVHVKLQQQSCSELLFCCRASQSWAGMFPGIWASVCFNTCPVGFLRWLRRDLSAARC